MENKNKSNKILIIIIVILLIGLAFTGGIILGQNLNKSESGTESKKIEEQKENETQEKTDDSEFIISDELKQELMKLAFTNEEHTPLPLGKYQLLTNDEKSRIIYDYAKNNSMIKRISGDEYDKCMDGAGFCNGIKEEDYKKIKYLYNFDNFEDSLIDYKFNGYNVYIYAEPLYQYDLKHNASIKKSDRGIMLIDEISFYNHGTDELKYKMNYGYEFIKREDGTYYIDSAGY